MDEASLFSIKKNFVLLIETFIIAIKISTINISYSAESIEPEIIASATMPEFSLIAFSIVARRSGLSFKN
jgi:hypothetical protein